MSPYEILLSESQERMLVVAKKGHEAQVRAILEKWDLSAAVIGEVIAEPVYRVTEGDRVVAEFPGSQLVSDCPMYNPPAAEDPAVARLRARDVHAIPELPAEKDPVWTLVRLLSSPTIASKRWAYRQYDSTVRTSTVLRPGDGDAAVIRIRHTDRAIALKTDCNGRYVSLDPRVGTQLAVAEAARNVACTGARPMAITNCLNFGNPKRPEVYFQFTQAVRGMGEACLALGTPVTGGNVSFYNESPARCGASDAGRRHGRAHRFARAHHALRLHHRGRRHRAAGRADERAWRQRVSRAHPRVVAGAPPALRSRAREGDDRRAPRCHSRRRHSLGARLQRRRIGRRARRMLHRRRRRNDRCRNRVDQVELACPRARCFSARGRRESSSARRSRRRCSSSRANTAFPARVIGQVRARESGLTIRIGERVIRAPLDRLARAYHDAIPDIMNASIAEVAVLEQHPQPSGA